MTHNVRVTDHLDAATPRPSTPTGHRPPPVTGEWADRLAVVVYAAVAVVALVGQATAAVHWLGWPLLASIGAVAVVELAAIAVAARADYRRRLGEPAVAARILSALIAAFMTGVNFAGHWFIGQQMAAWFFAGTTLVGYLIYLLHSAARRRDQLRAEGKLQTVTPEYGIWQWLRHPVITRRARQLVLRHPDLGLYGSLDAAVDAMAREKRNAALAAALEQRIADGMDPTMAKLATGIYDLDEIARRLAATADYDALAGLIARDLTPERLASSEPKVIDSQVVEPEPSSPAESGGGQVVPMRRASTRRTSTKRPATTSIPPSVEELVDTLCRVHCVDGPAKVGAPKAIRTLRQVYGSCSIERARAAKDSHYERHGFAGGGQVDADDQEGGSAWAV